MLFGSGCLMGVTSLYLGTSSWTAAGWETAIYPPKTKKENFLSFYAGRFNSVEIDSTFYRIPTAKTVQQWRERTPDNFVFAAKPRQSITHEKCLVGADADLNEFLGVMDLLGPKLGPLLIQMPYCNNSIISIPTRKSIRGGLPPQLTPVPWEHPHEKVWTFLVPILCVLNSSPTIACMRFLQPKK